MAVSATDGIVENLVTQFSSALDCFRELVQNAIDAGTPMVEVWTEYERGEGHTGTIIAHVDDFGEGMDERIIDEQLTNLFSSTKEDDLTKIGKFGIGFVSAFALQPKAVLVHTGRGGEYWEVLFHEDRSFSKTLMDAPTEGTQISIFMEGDLHRYRELVTGIEKTLIHWCAHTETEITFEDRTPADGGWSDPVTINREFVVEGTFPTVVDHQGTGIALAYSRQPSYGFYNRGLTLARTTSGEDVLDERARRYGHIAFKIKSRYLEHTLARETVMRDENYEKAMELLDAAADGPLLDALLARLTELVALDTWGQAEVYEYTRLLGFLALEPPQSLMRAGGQPILRAVSGGALSPDALYASWRDEGHVLVATATSPMTETLEANGHPVALGSPVATHDDAGLELVAGLFSRYAQIQESRTLRERAWKPMLRWIGFKPSPIAELIRRACVRPEAVYLPVIVDEETPDPIDAALVARAAELLKSVDAGYRALTTCRLADAVEDAPLFVVAKELGALMARPPRDDGMRKKRARKLSAAVNRDHRQFRALRALHDTQPDMAAYCLAKGVLLSEDRLLERDVALMQAAMGE